MIGRMVRCVCLVGALGLSTTITFAQLTIIPQSTVQEAANPTLAKGVSMQFDNNGLLDFGSIDESDGCWRGEIEWREIEGKCLSITRITSSCNCLVAEWDKRDNSNVASGVIGVKFLPKGHIGGVEQKLFIYTTLSDKEPSAVVRVQGRVTYSVGNNDNYPHSMGALRLRQKRVSLPQDGNIQRVAVMNGGSTPITITHDTRLSIGGIRAYTEPKQLESGKEGSLVIEYCPDGQPVMLYLDGIAVPPRERKMEIEIEK